MNKPVSDQVLFTAKAIHFITVTSKNPLFSQIKGQTIRYFVYLAYHGYN